MSLSKSVYWNVELLKRADCGCQSLAAWVLHLSRVHGCSPSLRGRVALCMGGPPVTGSSVVCSCALCAWVQFLVTYLWATPICVARHGVSPLAQAPECGMNESVSLEIYVRKICHSQDVEFLAFLRAFTWPGVLKPNSRRTFSSCVIRSGTSQVVHILEQWCTPLQCGTPPGFMADVLNNMDGLGTTWMGMVRCHMGRHGMVPH